GSTTPDTRTLAAQFAAYSKLRSGMPASEDGEQDIPPLGYAIAQLHGIYILSQSEKGLIIVDMHAAHERITYEHMKQAVANEALKVQPLLVPLGIAVSEGEAGCVEEHAPALEALGLVLERQGP